jgi:CheY-like chemotaxis protein
MRRQGHRHDENRQPGAGQRSEAAFTLGGNAQVVDRRGGAGLEGGPALRLSANLIVAVNTPITFEIASPEVVLIGGLDKKPGQVRTKRILVVDDDDMFLPLAATVLTQAGFRVDTAVDGEAGWSALCAGAYDLLITDDDMPRLTGVELVRRAREAGMTLPVVMASGSSVLEAIHGSGWLELAAFLHKPFAIHELADTASRIVSTGPQPGAVQFVPPRDRWGLNE